MSTPTCGESNLCFSKKRTIMNRVWNCFIASVLACSWKVQCYQRGITDIALGYNVTTSNVVSEGMSTIILDGLQLISSEVSGFHVTLAEDNCDIRLEVWDKLNSTNYRLARFKEFRGNKGYHEVPLSNTEQFSVTADQKLGFSSIKSTCVGYLYVQDKRRSQTMFHSFKLSNTRPLVNSVYYFDPYQSTFLFPIGIIVKDPNPTTPPPTTTTTPPPTRSPDTLGKFIGYNYTTDLMAITGPASIVHHGLQLESGTVIGFRFRIAKPNCRVRLQLWRKVDITERYYNYTLIYQKYYNSGSNVGLIYLPLSPSEYFEIVDSDKLGFTTEDVKDSCVPFHYVQDSLRSQTVKKIYPNSNYPRLYDTVSFPPYQTTKLFALEVEMLVRAKTGETGPQGFQGNAGQQGERGDKGDVGLRGVKGVRGDPGMVGDRGETGIKGPEGYTGPDGSEGQRGEGGPSGRNGSSGPKGVKGGQGPLGDKGPVGERGEIGERGPPGHTGATGVTGEALRGPEGETGVVGPIGSTGLPGKVGDVGESGPDGDQGAGGSVGVTGQRGPMWSPHKVNYCEQSKLKCEHYCMDTPLGAKCGCRPGYLPSEGSRCLEINECYIENGNCQYDCINTPGSYHCGCPLGLKLSNDSHKCDDFDECAAGLTKCKVNQLCINIWNGYYCAGPFEKDKGSVSSQASAQVGDNVHLVTRDVLIGLILWLIILTILTIMAVILMLPECRDCCRSKPHYHTAGGRRPQFYYPAFFPRVSLERRPSAERMDILEGRQSRNEERHENEGIINEAHIHDPNIRSEL